MRQPLPRVVPGDLELEDLIKHVGIPGFVAVAQIAERLYEVIDGERRISIAKRLHERGALGQTKVLVNCVVIPLQDDRDRAWWRMVLNSSSPLSQAERLELCSMALGRPVAPSKDRVAPNGEVTGQRLEELMQSLATRRGAIRHSRKAISILEIARDFVLGFAPMPESVEKLRRVCGDDSFESGGAL